MSLFFFSRLMLLDIFVMKLLEFFDVVDDL